MERGPLQRPFSFPHLLVSSRPPARPPRATAHHAPPPTQLARYQPTHPVTRPPHQPTIHPLNKAPSQAVNRTTQPLAPTNLRPFNRRIESTTTRTRNHRQTSEPSHANEPISDRKPTTVNQLARIATMTTNPSSRTIIKNVLNYHTKKYTL